MTEATTTLTRAAANTNPLLNKIAAATHLLMNLAVIAVALSGLVTAATSGMIDAIKRGDAGLIPDFHKIPAKDFHETFFTLLLLLVAFHIAAALYHQFIVKDKLLRRIMIRRFDNRTIGQLWRHQSRPWTHHF